MPERAYCGMNDPAPRHPAAVLENPSLEMQAGNPILYPDTAVKGPPIRSSPSSCRLVTMRRSSARPSTAPSTTHLPTGELVVVDDGSLDDTAHGLPGCAVTVMAGSPPSATDPRHTRSSSDCRPRGFAPRNRHSVDGERG